MAGLAIFPRRTRRTSTGADAEFAKLILLLISSWRWGMAHLTPVPGGQMGIATDFGAAGVGTWDDTKGLVGDIGGAAKSVWHGITSLF